jgi:hypothetical protein
MGVAAMQEHGTKYSYECGCKCDLCRAAVAAYCKEYRITHPPKQYPEIARRGHLRRKFNLTIEQYEEMLNKQHGVCLICGKPPKDRRLAVDHDHKTGKIRGLLCGICNRHLGWVENNIMNTLKYISGEVQ